jgi:EpsI family protein
MKSKSARFWILVVFLVAGGVLVNYGERAGEARVARTALKDFPAQVGDWKQRRADVRFDAATEAVLRADDYVLRDYARADGRTASLYIGYYATQRSGATYHSPLNCMPGSGWTLSAHDVIKIEPVGGAPAFEANRYVIQNGTERHLLVYWYQGRGRAVASEYWDKVYTVWDSARLRRSDGSMVRVLVPIGKSEAEAVESAVSIAAGVAPELPRFVPQ